MRWNECADRLPEDQDLVAVEVGVWRSDLSIRLLALRPRLVLYMVDPWTPQSQGERLQGIYPAEDAQDLAAYVAELSRGRGRPMKMTSVEAAKRFKRASLDLVFIDGNHSPRFILEDIHAWLPKVKKGGYIGGHDYCAMRSGLRNVVDTSFHSVEVGDDLTWFSKV